MINELEIGQRLICNGVESIILSKESSLQVTNYNTDKIKIMFDHRSKVWFRSVTEIKINDKHYKIFPEISRDIEQVITQSQQTYNFKKDGFFKTLSQMFDPQQIYCSVIIIGEEK